MFRKWLETHSTSDVDLTHPLYPKAADREFWDGKYDPYYVLEAEEYLGYEWPMVRATQYMELVKSGNRRAQEDPHFARRTALCALVMGELTEYKGRFLPDITDGILAICEETFWGVSAHVCGMPTVRSRATIDLFAAETASLLAVICYLLREELDSLCPELISIVDLELRRRIMDQYTERTDYAWMGYSYPVNNWTPWIISNLLTVFLLCEKDKALLSKAVDKMLYEINTIYSTLPDDGGCDEGACYWAVSGGTLFEFCDQLCTASAGVIDFFSDEKLRRICEFEYRVYLGGGYFANFADGTPKVTHSLAGLLYRMKLRFNDSRFGELSRDLVHNDSKRQKMAPGVERDAKIKRRLHEMMYMKDIEKEGAVSFDETELFSRTQIAVLRDGAWSVAAKGGHNAESHNHNDVGSFVAYYDAAPVLVDPSCGTYTAATFRAGGRYEIWTNNSDWHNLPTINGKKQSEGREYRADSFSASGKIVEISFHEAYPSDAALQSMKRCVGIDAGGIAVTDEIVLSGKGGFTENFITPYAVRIENGRAIIGEHFALECDACQSLSLDSEPFNGDERLTLYWQTDEMKRIRFAFDGVESAVVRFTLRRI